MNPEEVLSLLQMVVESCKSLPLACGFFYDELLGLVGCTKLHPFVIEWLSKHIGEFEGLFILDIKFGHLQVEFDPCGFFSH